MPRTARLRPLALLALAALAVPLGAQERITSDGPVIVCELPIPEGDAEHEHAAAHAPSLPTPGGEVPRSYVVTHGASATFEVTYTGFPPDAEAAFQAAVDIWADHVASEVPIEIDASWEPLGQNILGSAGPFLVRDFSGAPVAGTWYPTALANAITGRDIDPGQPDIDANFSSAFDRWYFGTDGQPGADEVDLTTIVLHEIGHGLGFISSFMASGATGTYGLDADNDNPRPFVFDREVVDEEGRSLLNPTLYPEGGSALAFQLQDEAYLGGCEATTARLYGNLVPLHTPTTFLEGTSISHFDETTFPRTTPNALMTPFISNNEVIRSPGPVGCAAFQEFGWPLGAACEALIPAALPPVAPGCSAVVTLPDVYDLRLRQQVGGGALTTFELVVEEAQNVTVLVFDATGRRVAEQNTFADTGVPIDVVIDAARLASGVYFVRFVGEAFAATESFVRVR